MIRRILYEQIVDLPKGVLLLGPRQVGKSTLLATLGPDLVINLAEEETFSNHIKDPGLILRRIEALPKAKLILIDEVQRIPSILNSVQALSDSNKSRRFLLTGSSARKLKRGQANLLPGRVFTKRITPLNYWELKSQFNLEVALTKGLLPEIYLNDYGIDLLESYVAGYLREEIQAEALTKDLGAYSRFLDLAAELSGQYLNYSKVASDSEINKETIRRYFDILSDTLIIERVPTFTKVEKSRKARQKDRFIFFDLGVRNVLLNRHRASLSQEEVGALFEQFILLQCISYKYCYNKNWRILSYLDAGGVDVDLIIEGSAGLVCVEVKSATKVNQAMFKNLDLFQSLAKNKIKKYLVYRGQLAQKFSDGLALPYTQFFDEILPTL